MHRVSYRHTQVAYLPLAVVAFLGLVLLYMTALGPSNNGALATIAVILAILGVILQAFNRLTVTVSDDEIHVFFRWGRPHRRFQLADLISATPVRNRWVYGFGVRSTPHGWLYNVWGLDAVELRLRGGEVFRIGTDEPGPLTAVLMPPPTDNHDPGEAEEAL